MKENVIYQLKITLNHTNPEIWRRIMVDNGTLLPEFHKIIQASMGWTNSHLHQFIANGQFYAEPDPDDQFDSIDYRNTKLSELLKIEKDHIQYEYDFGDGWIHEITLEKVLLKEGNTQYPNCTAGENACPPEDCGGPWGYENLLNIMNDPSHVEYDEMKEWIGIKFEPEKIDLIDVNERLQSEDYGIISFFD